MASTSLLLHHVALSLVEGLGPIQTKPLLARFGSVAQIFEARRSELAKVIRPGLVNRLIAPDLMDRACNEIQFMEQAGIRALSFWDVDYPFRLKECSDAPFLLYYKGTAKLNASKVLAVVGTRRCSAYGAKICTQLIRDLAGYNPLVVSGMAVGIDIAAHRAALEAGLETVAVMGPGLNQIYPPQHQADSEMISNQGGLIAEYPSQVKQTPGMFPRRNRIIAGIADAVLVVESGRRGGAMITARIARGYDREVLAVPGRSGDIKSEGCNLLIKSQVAALVETAADVPYALGWESMPGKRVAPVVIEQNLTPDEQSVLKFLNERGPSHIDLISGATGLSPGRIASSVLGLELKGVVSSGPGNVVRLG